MRRDELVESMGRILSLYRLPKTESEKNHQNEYLATIFDSVGWMSPLQFDEVCGMIAQTAGGMKKPMPKDFLSTFKDLSSKRKWTRPQGESCQRCEGIGFIDTILTNIETLEKRSTMRPCPSCKPSEDIAEGYREDPPSPPKSENKATNWMLEEIERDYYPPKAAQDILARIDEEKINFPEEVVSALVEKAGK
jgi:hypothetical protein